MRNELVLIFSLIIIYSGVLLAYLLFGKTGLICWSAIATIIANIEVVILINAFGIDQTLGNVLFASTFLVTDILSETEGKAEANLAVHIGVFTSAAFIILSQLWFLYMPSGDPTTWQAMDKVFSNSPRILMAGLLVYAVIQRFDVWIYHKIWMTTSKKTGSKRRYLYLRNNASTLLSQLLNAILFTVAAFWGHYPPETLLSIAASSYVIFIFTSFLDTPYVYLARMLHDRRKTGALLSRK